MLETAYLYRSIQLYHSFILMFDCHMLFTEINATAADDLSNGATLMILNDHYPQFQGHAIL